MCIFIYEHAIERVRERDSMKRKRFKENQSWIRGNVEESFCIFGLDNLRRENRCNQTQQNKPNHLTVI